MTEKFITSFISLGLAIVGLAALAVLLSKNAQSTNVLVSLGKGLSSAIQTAICPITGNCPSVSTLPIGTSTSTITFG